MKKTLLAVAAAMMLASCGATTGSVAVPPLPIGQQTVIDEKAMIGLEQAYVTVTDAFLAADRRNLLPQATEDEARAVLIRAYDYLVLARAAYRAGDSLEFNRQVTATYFALDGAKRLLGL